MLAIALLGWFLRNANIGHVWGAVRNARPGLLACSLAMVFLTYWARAIRWQHLLGPIGPTRFRTALRTTVIGFAATFVLPARAGDVLRPYLLARQEGLSASATFATIVIERVLDLAAVLMLLAFYVWGSGASGIPEHLRTAIHVSAAVAAFGAAVLAILMVVLARHPERVGVIVLRVNRVLPHRIADALSSFARAFSEGLIAVRTPKALGLAFAWSFPLWILLSLESYFVTRAFGIDMSVTGGYLLQGLLIIGVAVPTPGGVGGFHEAYRFGVTTFFGASNDSAVGAAIVLHAVSFIPVTLAGLYFMAQDGMSLRGLKGLARAAHQAEEPVSDEVPVLRSPGR